MLIFQAGVKPEFDNFLFLNLNIAQGHYVVSAK